MLNPLAVPVIINIRLTVGNLLRNVDIFSVRRKPEAAILIDCRCRRICRVKRGTGNHIPLFIHRFRKYGIVGKR